MTTCLVLGGGATLHDDLERARKTVPFDAVVACNEAGIEWPGELRAWVSLHARYYSTGPNWRKQRADKGYPPAKAHYGHPEAFKGANMPDVIATPYSFAGEKSGSSGLFAAKVALVDLGFDRVVFCGVPMDPIPHFTGRESWVPRDTDGRTSAHGFRNSWLAVPQDYRDRMRSMSGWTRVLLGAPEELTETKETYRCPS
jgi:hypothetical protein